MTKPRALQYQDVCLEIICSEGTWLEMLANVEPFFREITWEPRKYDVSISCFDSEYPEVLDNEFEVIDVDTSLYRHLSSQGKLRRFTNSEYSVFVENTGSYVVFDRDKQTARLYQKIPNLLTLDLVRMLKQITTILVEVSGSIQLHAAAVEIGNESTMILGDMWQGKTTLLLEMLRSFDCSQVSCDTCNLTIRNGTVSIAGWPSPFSMSHGTMSDFAELWPYVPAEGMSKTYETRWKDRKKTVLTSQEVCELFDAELKPTNESLTTIIISKFIPEGVTGIEKVDRKILEKELKNCYLGSRDPIYHNWPMLREIDSSSIDINIARYADHLSSNADVYVLTWGPSAVSLLRTLDTLDSASSIYSGSGK